MTTLLITNDLVTGTATGMVAGTRLPAALAGVPSRLLRHIDGEIVDISAVEREWHIDALGRPRLEASSDRQPLTCAGGAELVRDTDTGLWRERTEVDILAEAIGAAIVSIDRAAESVRTAYLTSGEGQAMVYQAKASEAQALLGLVSTGGTPVSSDYPHLAIEVGITAETLVGVAEVVSAQVAAWTAVSVAIEGTRLSAKTAVRAATSAEEVSAILASLSWPS
jgi:hypothetical protein